MASLNKMILIGNLGADPETRSLGSSDPVCTLRLATTDQWKDKASGETREATEWHRVVLFREIRAALAGHGLALGMVFAADEAHLLLSGSHNAWEIGRPRPL